MKCLHLGKFIVNSSSNNPISEDSVGSGFLIVEALNPNSYNPTSFQWILQKWFPINFDGYAYRIIYRNSLEPIQYIFNDWKITDNSQIGKLIYRGNLYDYYNSVGTITTAQDFNEIIKDGLYVVTVDNNPNNPFQSSGFLEVNSFQMNSEAWIWCHQIYMDFSLNKKAERIIRISRRGEENIYEDWRIIYDNSINTFSLKGKNVINFGDSIFGNYRDSSSITQQIINITSANVINCAFGGTQMSYHERTEYNPFSFCNLVDAIISKDWTTQESSAQNRPADMPAYFITALENLENIDFNNVDYVTIAFGTNDYANGSNLDSEDNLYDKSTFAGALRYSIETLLNAYPNLRILIGTPAWRCWLNNSNQVVQTSDEKTFEGNFTLIEMAEKIKEVAKEYHIPVINVYDNLGLNKYNWSAFFSSSDTVHPNSYGRECLGKEYAYALLNM